MKRMVWCGCWLFLGVRGVVGMPVAMQGDGGSYTQRFDALPTGTSGTSAWTNDATISGWYSDKTSFVMTDSYGGLKSYTNGTGRALGALAIGDTDGKPRVSFAVALTNAAPFAMTNLQVAFTGVIGRTGAAETTLTCAWQVTNGVASITNSGVWTVASNLTFTAGPSPVVGTTVPFAAAVPVVIQPGQCLMLRWQMLNKSSQSGLGVDDLTIGWQGEIPSAVLVAAGGARETFNGLGGATNAVLPIGWRVDAKTTVRTVGAYAAAGTNTTRCGGSNLPASAGNGIYNFGAGAAETAVDRAVGGLSSSDASKTVNLYACCANVTGRSVKRWTVDFAVEKYRCGTNPAGFGVTLQVSRDGVNWTAVPAGAVTFPADLDNSGFTPAPGVAVRRSAVVDWPVEAGEFFYLAWSYSVASGSTTSNAQALGVDDVVIKPFGSTVIGVW